MIGRALVILVIVIVGVPVLGLAALLAMDYLSSNTIHQKLEMVVETPGGAKVGSSVAAVTMGSQPFVPGWPGGRGYKHLRGEATVLEVAPGRYLFALIGGQAVLAQQVFAAEIGLDKEPARRPEMEVWLDRLARLRGKREIPEKLYPLLVTFTDINDPKTVQRVDPDDLDAAFGCPPFAAGPASAAGAGAGPRTDAGADAWAKQCHSLKSIALEITDEKVTRGRVEAVLGWLETIGGGMLDGNRISTIKAQNRLANDLTRLHFKRN